MTSNASRALVAVVSLAAAPIQAEPPAALRLGAPARHDVYLAPPLVLEANLEGPALTDVEQVWRTIQELRGQMGSGGDVANLEAVQVLYSDAKRGNLVQLLWEESSLNSAGVKVSEDDVEVGVAPGLPENELPGVNQFLLEQRTSGEHTWSVAAGGASAEAMLEVLAAQPFSNVSDLKCESPPFFHPETAQCGMAISWNIVGDEPDTLSLFINGIFQGTLNGATRSILIVGAPPDTYEVAVRGFRLAGQNGFYAGTASRTTCTVACEDLPCNPVFITRVCQIAYGPEPGNNGLLVQHTNGEARYASGVTLFVDDQPVGFGPGEGPGGDWFSYGLLPIGDRRVAIQGDCGQDGKSDLSERTFGVLSQTPHTNPIVGGLQCSFDAAMGQTKVSWTKGDSSEFILVSVVREDSIQAVIEVDGLNTEVVVPSTEETDTLGLVFFRNIDGFCYGSTPVICSATPTGNLYIQGVCDGDGAGPVITSAIFGLNYLFLGGPAPPCLQACDANGSGSLDLSDMVYILNFLFQGGPPPTTWGGDTPACTTAAPGDDCEIPNPACPI